jgi:hypothetical protein
MLFHIQLNSQGITYKQKVNDALVDLPLEPPRASRTANRPAAETPPREPATASNIASVDYILTQINACIEGAKRSSAAGMLIITVLLAVCIAALIAYLVQSNAARIAPGTYQLLSAAPFIVAPLILICGVWLARSAHKREQAARITTLHYDLDDISTALFIAVQNAFANLGQSVAIWEVLSQAPGWDLKRSKSPTALIDRKPITSGYMRPPFIRTRLKVYGIALETMQWFFLPDHIFVFEKRRYRIIRYDALQVVSSFIDYLEAGEVPSDARVRVIGCD